MEKNRITKEMLEEAERLKTMFERMLDRETDRLRKARYRAERQEEEIIELVVGDCLKPHIVSRQ